MSRKAEPSYRKRRSIFTVETRENRSPTSYLETLVHIVKANVGAGMFAMGNAFKDGGLIISLILIPIIALIGVHCQHVLVASAERMRVLYGEDHCADYAETVELCFLNGPTKMQTWARGMRITINVFICVTQLGFCCIYFEFISANVFQVLEANNIIIAERILMVIFCVPILLISLITNLKLLMPVSLMANICLFISLCLTIYFTLSEGLPDIDQRRYFPDGWKLALFFGTAIFSFEGIALVLPLRNVMKHPSKFEETFGVLNVGMVITTTMFAAAGTLGYMKWGEDVLGSLTLNVGDSPLAQFLKCISALGILLGYPLQFFIAIEIMLSSELKNCICNNRPLLSELIFRAIMVIVTLIFAEIIPALALFISLIGSVCSTALALVFPPVIEWILLEEDNRSILCKIFMIIKNIIIIILALLGFVLGTYISLKELYLRFSAEDEVHVLN